MKYFVRLSRPLILILIVGAGSFFISCDAINNLVPDVPLTISLDVAVANSPATQSVANPFDLSTNAKYNEHKDKISGAELTKLVFTLLTYNGTPPAPSATYSSIKYSLKFDPAYGDDTMYDLGTFTNVNAGVLLTAPDTLTVDNAALNTALSNLKNRPKFSIISEYTLVGGGGTIVAMTGKIDLTFVLKLAAV